jgi:hypothetical protein
MKDQITLYSAVTIPYPLPRVPSKAFEKLCGLSTFRWPARATQPVTVMIRMMMSLIMPRTFCSRRPHFTAVAWIRKAAEMHASPMPRWFHRVTSTCAAFRIYSPKMTLFPAAHPSRTA